MELVHDLKDKRTFTNIEKNVYSALDDEPTIMELCVLVLYSQSISHPYMQVVHGPDASTTNLLDLGPIHNQVMDYCCKIISDPDLLISPSASYATGTLDSKIWDNPEAIYAVL